MMTSSPITEEAADLPRIKLQTPARSSAHASRPSERPSTSPTLDVMLSEARDHRARCEALLEVLGAPVSQGAVNTSSKES